MTLHDHPVRATAAAAAPVQIRPAVPGDAAAAGRIIYGAFSSFHESRGYAPDFPSVEAAVGLGAAG